MSVINKKPFINSLLESMSPEDLQTLSVFIDGGGDQTPLKRTANPIDSRACPHIGPADKGVHLCNLTINYTNFLGYLIYNDDYCVLISFTDAQVLKMFEIDGYDANTVDEAITVLELRSALYETMNGDADGSVFEDIEVKIYYSDITVNEGNIVVTNAEKAAILKDIYKKAEALEHFTALYELPQDLVMESDPTLSGQIANMVHNPFVKSLLIYTYSLNYGSLFGVGITLVGPDEAVYVGTIGYSNDEKNAIATKLATDSSSYIRLKFRIETGEGSGGGATPTDTKTNEQKLQAMLQLLHTFDNENPAAFDETFEFEAFRYADIVNLLEHPESPFVFDAGFGAFFNNEDIWYAMRDGKFQILDVYSRVTINDLTSDQYRPTAYSVEIPNPTINIMDDDEPHDCLLNLRYVFDTGDSNIYQPSDNDLFTFKIRFKYDPNPVEPINPK